MASASNSPSVSPSDSPSASPSASSSVSPSVSPSKSPSASPSVSPSASPSPIPAGDVVYTIHDPKVRLGKKHFNFIQIVFGGSNDSYPSGGVPLSVAGLGMRDTVDAVIILESGVSGHEFEWDRSANTLRMKTTFGTEETTAQTLTEHTLEVLAIGW